jgi:hypothetical protein
MCILVNAILVKTTLITVSPRSKTLTSVCNYSELLLYNDIYMYSFGIAGTSHYFDKFHCIHFQNIDAWAKFCSNAITEHVDVKTRKLLQI